MTLELGKFQTLEVLRIRDFGAYLGIKGSEESVLLPARQVPEGTRVGDRIDVFLYKDSSDRIISTTTRPKIVMGELARLTVKDRTKIGAFLDWGLEKDLFLPFKEQTSPVRKGDSCLVSLYEDKSGRLCATMKVYDKLSCESPYSEGDQVSGVIYRINPEVGVFVAVDEKYYGLIPAAEMYDSYRVGDIAACRVAKRRPDGKLNLSARQVAYLQMDEDAQIILAAMREYGGYLPFGEKASPEIIKSRLKMSKNAFKRALGRLLKDGKITIEEDRITLVGTE